MVLGCRLFVKEVTREGTGLKLGDILTRISGVSAENMSLKEAKKLMDQSKERLSIVVSRESTRDNNVYSNCQQQMQQQNHQHHHSQQQQQQNLNSPSNTSGKTIDGQTNGEYLTNLGASYSSQNLYVPPPKRQTVDDKSNLAPRGRSRGPLLDVSLSQLDLPATPTQDPPRPPPPRPEDYYGTRRQAYDEDPLIQRAKQPV